MSAGQWAELLLESSRREARCREEAQARVAGLLLGDTMIVLGRPVRVLGLEWPEGEPPGWRPFFGALRNLDGVRR